MGDWLVFIVWRYVYGLNGWVGVYQPPSLSFCLALSSSFPGSFIQVSIWADYCLW